MKRVIEILSKNPAKLFKKDQILYLENRIDIT
jgi:hypothetical protein